MIILNGKVIIRPDPAPDTIRGIAISDKAKENEYAPQSGTVIAFDQAPHPITGKTYDLKVGEHIYYPSYAARIKLEGLVIIDLTELWFVASTDEFNQLTQSN